MVGQMALPALGIGRPRRHASLLSLLICLICGASVLAFVANGAVRRARRPGAWRRAEAQAPAPAPETAQEEAARTRGVFMSLDTEEFGLDSEEQAKIPEKPKEETFLDKAGDGAASLGAVAVFTAVLVAVTFYVFFTKQGEESFYYSGMRDRTERFGPEDVGLDFREFDNGATEGTKALEAASSPPPSVPNENLKIPQQP
mmetsp:Transcript_16756/g.46098  ORF Transcript_16756/g.46098 Transcript_16756/m.46098 type:complete len:200 (-) Transcript_16756:76-675(-)|eukprot:CAMPEP_0179104978 /NCGR_PEP_ID=MMETSP0796-20121207/48731_1 /TAXON_ID=73915 /ORGANISM="Pyrodinium bahamense, Strain pbaha01" /LENGTH=199 /DNA_ID=CAMNT_0020802951 /DNA_START=45 /DNA_END=644 /DNA_ORIENTATION=+